MSRSPQPWCVKVKSDFTLVIHGGDCRPYLELRPKYEEGIGPVIDLYKVSTVEPTWLARAHVTAVRELVRYLPTVTNTAMRMAARAGRKPSIQAESEPLG